MSMDTLKYKRLSLASLPRSYQRRLRGASGQSSGSQGNIVSSQAGSGYWTLDDKGTLHTPYNVAAAGNIAALSTADMNTDLPLAPRQRITCGKAYLYFDPDTDTWHTNKQIVVDQ